MKITLVCNGHWDDKTGREVKINRNGLELILGHFHAGCTFNAEINLNSEEKKELARHMAAGFRPVFYALPERKQS